MPESTEDLGKRSYSMVQPFTVHSFLTKDTDAVLLLQSGSGSRKELTHSHDEAWELEKANRRMTKF